MHAATWMFRTSVPTIAETPREMADTFASTVPPDRLICISACEGEGYSSASVCYWEEDGAGDP